VQGTAAREVGTQEFHLVSQYPPALQVNILGMRRDERHGQQLHARLLRCTSCLVIVTTPAGSDHVAPDILATLDDRCHVIPRQRIVAEVFTAIKTHMGIASEQGRIIQRRDITVAKLVQRPIMAQCRNNGIHLDDAALAGFGIDSAMHAVQEGSTGIGHLFLVIEAYRILVPDPFEWHT